jgi:phage-related protein
MILLNKDVENNELLKDVQAFLEKQYEIKTFQWKNIFDSQLIDISQFKSR